MISTPLVIGPGSVTAEMQNSGAATAGQMLTADGAGGADYAAPAGGGRTRLAYLGNPGTGESTPTSAEVTAAWVAETGSAPQEGDVAVIWDQYGNIGGIFFVAIYSLKSELPAWSAFTMTLVVDL